MSKRQLAISVNGDNLARYLRGSVQTENRNPSNALAQSADRMEAKRRQRELQQLAPLWDWVRSE